MFWSLMSIAKSRSTFPSTSWPQYAKFWDSSIFFRGSPPKHTHTHTRTMKYKIADGHPKTWVVPLGWMVLIFPWSTEFFDETLGSCASRWRLSLKQQSGASKMRKPADQANPVLLSTSNLLAVTPREHTRGHVLGTPPSDEKKFSHENLNLKIWISYFLTRLWIPMS